MEVRLANPKDAPRWIDLLKGVIGCDYTAKQVYNEAFVASLLDPRNGEETYILESENKLLSSISILKPAAYLNNPVMNLGRVFFDKESYSDGSAKLAVEKMTRLAKERQQLIVTRVPEDDKRQQELFESCGFICVGYQPYKHIIQTRKGFFYYVYNTAGVLEARAEVSESLSEISELASAVLGMLGISNPAVVRDGIAGYPLQTDLKIHDATVDDFELWKLQASGPSVVPEFSTGYNRGTGFLRLPLPGQLRAILGQRGSQITGGLLFLNDEYDRCVRIVDGFSIDDLTTGALLQVAVKVATEQFSAGYVEADLLATSPRLLKCAEQLGFVPVAYFPGFYRMNDRVSDVVKMAKLNMPYNQEALDLTINASKIFKIIDGNFQDLKLGVAIISLLRTLPIFNGLGDGELRKIARLCERKLYRPGERVFDRGDSGDEAYIIMRGQVDICLSEDTKPIATIGSGQIFGEQAFLDGAPRTAMAIASQASIVLIVQRSAFNELVQREPHLGMVIMRNIAVDLSNKLRKANTALMGKK